MAEIVEFAEFPCCGGASFPSGGGFRATSRSIQSPGRASSVSGSRNGWKMKALLLNKPGDLVATQIDEPPLPGPGEALVRVHRVGICGSDISGYLGKMPFYSYPRIPGHELGVEVLAIGSDVANVKKGDKCSVEPYINQVTSHASGRGRGNCCEQLQVLGVHTDGGMRSRFILPARKLHPARTLSMEQLALVETLAIGCHAVDRCAPQADEFVLVIGAGPIGLSVIEFVKLTGAKLIVLDMNQNRLDFCKNIMLVPDVVRFVGDGSELKRIEELTGGALPTVVIDATGSPKSMAGAFEFVGHTGRICFVGIIPGEVTFSDPLFHRREMTILASRNALPKDFGRIIRLIEGGKIDTQPWITHHYALDSLPSQFPTIIKPETGVIKAIVEIPE
jgi:2-desacetyl-2-hydroxyethyl bacteriochlorophyllide A dehydrogenase